MASVTHIVQNVCACLGHLMNGAGHMTHWCCLWWSQQHHVSFENHGCMYYSVWDKICEYLEKVHLYSNGRHWVDSPITPTLLTHQVLRPEREGDWLPQQLCIKYLLPCISIAGHRPLCKVPFIALSRDVNASGCRCQGRSSLRRICLQTQYRQLICWRADGSKDREKES